MNIYISLVGNSPSEIAVAAKTIHCEYHLDRIYLLPSNRTSHRASKLKSFFHSLDANIKVHIEETNIYSPHLPDRFNDIFNSFTPEDIIFLDITPGLNFAIARMGAGIKKNDNIHICYGDHNHLYLINEDKKIKKCNIGLKHLLQLYDVKTNKKISDNVRIENDIVLYYKDYSFPIKQCKEQYGLLYGLVTVTLNPDEERKEILFKARNLEALRKASRLLNTIPLDITAVTNDSPTSQRLKLYGIKTKFLKQKNASLNQCIADWEKSLSQNASNFTPRLKEQKLILNNMEPLVYEVQGARKKVSQLSQIQQLKTRYWSGQGLLTVLGSDPAATLTTIFTHKPEELILLIDTKTETILYLAARIKKMIENGHIPVRKVTFWPCTLWGQIINQEQLEKLLQKKQWIVNVTPGTKGQSFTLGTLAGPKLYSLRTDQLVSLNLYNDNEKIPYSSAPLIVQGYVSGGALQGVEFTKDDIDRQMNFLTAMTKFIASYTAEGQYFPRRGWQKNLVLCAKNGTLKCTNVDSEREKLKFLVHLKGHQPLTGTLKSKPDTGHWLEPIVAAAFLRAGRDKITDLAVGIKWDWPKKKKSESFRTEIDVALVWEHQYLGISCKLGVEKGYFQKVRNEIMAEARTNFGRFAVPVLVRGGIRATHCVNIAQSSTKSELLQIPLPILDQSELIAGLVEKFLKNKRTV